MTEWVSLGTLKAMEDDDVIVIEGGPLSLVYCMIALSSNAGPELKYQVTKLLQSSTGKSVRFLQNKPCSSESPSHTGHRKSCTWLKALRQRVTTALGLSRQMNPLHNLIPQPLKKHKQLYRLRQSWG